MLVNLTHDQLRDELLRVADDPTGANIFFGQFAYVQELHQGNYSGAFDHGVQLLHLCRELAHDAYVKVHKGTPFYWLGTAAFQMHDYEIAVFFYDAAVSEDLRIGHDPVTHSSPSLRFIQVEGDQPEQAARPLVAATQQRLERAINDYNSIPGRPVNVPPLQLSDVRSCFLRPAVSIGGEGLRTLATAFISFCLEWDYMATLTMLRPGEGTTEPFFVHLFKGCLLFESLLKANRKKPPKNAANLGQALQYLHLDLGIPHNLAIGGVDFATILASLPAAANSIPISIEYAGKIRNTVGHHLGWKAPLEAKSYDSLATKVACACLHAIACLYR